MKSKPITPEDAAKIPEPKRSQRGRRTTYTEAQIGALLEWIAEGLTQGEINVRSANFDPAFKVSSSVCTHYRKSRSVDIDALRQTQEHLALSTGLAVKTNRVMALYRLAKHLEDDIELRKRLWMDRVKSITVGKGEYEKITEKEFMGSLVKELRGIYDDIAKEVGGRVLKADLTSLGKEIKAYVQISPSDWDDLQKTAQEEEDQNAV